MDIVEKLNGGWSVKNYGHGWFMAIPGYNKDSETSPKHVASKIVNMLLKDKEVSIVEKDNYVELKLN